MNFRNLKADEVEARVSQVTEKGVVLLIYKDARCDMRILDETVGPENWQREHYECKGNLFCRVGINVNYNTPEHVGRWVWKSDCGTESNTEAEKGEASDSFKRACFNWGIGRELYTAPFIWVPASMVEIKTGKNGKPSCYDRFTVTKLEVKDGKIIDLEICRKGNPVYSFGLSPASEPVQREKKDTPHEEEILPPGQARCPKCGRIQGPRKGLSGYEVIARLDGMCDLCYSKAHRGEVS